MLDECEQAPACVFYCDLNNLKLMTMKRILSLCLIALFQLALYAQAGGEGGAQEAFTLNLQVSPSAAGSLSENASAQYTAGTEIWLEAYANENYEFQYWEEEGAVVSQSRGFMYTMPARNVNLKAVFRYNPESPGNPEPPKGTYTLNLQVSPNNAGSLNNATTGRYKADTQLWLNAYANTGYEFVAWKENGEVVSNSRSFYYVMPERDATLTAVFRYNPSNPGNPETPPQTSYLYLESQPAGVGSFNWSTPAKIECGQWVNVVAYHNGGWKFREWQKDGVAVSNKQNYDFEMPEEDLHLVAVFDYSPDNPVNPGANYWNSETGEVIVDDFQPGSLYSAINNLVGGATDQVKMITVAGVADINDWGIVNDFGSCAVFDFSRVTGLTQIYSWAFEYAKAMTDIMLPATLTSIGNYAFYQLQNLKSITCYALTPPSVGSSTFYGVSTDMVVYVPANAVGLYQEAQGWKNFTIMPIQAEVTTLQVNLPEDIDRSIYKDMYIELLNINSGQKQRLVVTDRNTYTFNSIMFNSEFNIYLRNHKDVVLGEILNVKVKNQPLEVTFENLVTPRTVALKVVAPGGTDVTAQTTITWTDAQGNFLAQDSIVAGLLEGEKVKYHIALSRQLAMNYLQPADSLYEVQSANQLEVELKPIPLMTMNGTVRDLKKDQPLANAIVSISQTLNGNYSHTVVTKTNANGEWFQPVYVAPTDITASKVGYVSKSLSLEQPLATVPPFELRDITGTTIELNLTYTDVQGNTTEGYADYANVTFSVKNLTTGEDVTELSLQYPKIVLMDQLPAGTILRVTATSKKQSFMPVEATAEVDNLDKAEVTLPIKQLGAISAKFVTTDNTDIVGILYDGNGNLLRKYSYTDNALLISELVDGKYTLVTMGSSQFFNGIASLSQLYSAGLREGVDFVKNSCVVKSGQICYVTNQLIPYLDQTRFYYTGPNTSFSVNKTQVTVGQYLTLTGRIDFKSRYASHVSDVSLIVNLPEGVAFVEGSVLAGNNTVPYTSEPGTITIPVENLKSAIRLCVIPTVGGELSAAAAVKFSFDGVEMVQPIGSVTFTAENLSINVPAIVASTTVPVNGTALGRSKVEIFENGILAGQTTALANGSWATTIELNNTDEMQLSTHDVYAQVTTQQGMSLQSETRRVTYDSQAIQVEEVRMYHWNPEVNGWRGKNYEVIFNFLDPSNVAPKYIYYIYNRTFTFTIKFTENNPEKITDVVLYVKLGDGRWKPISTVFDNKSHQWVASAELGNMYDGIIPVNVAIACKVNGVANDESTGHGQESGCVDARPAIDPSGYVYEGVPSNRMQGVLATAYYKETVEDQYGDLHESVILWDAEEYAQKNPLFTDEQGVYRWDVPQGLWQVKFEKEGYQTTYSEWLPVPPPQLEVNIPITQLRQPMVKAAKVDEDGADIEFDKYMIPATLTTDNIILTRNDQAVGGSITLLNEEAASEDNPEITFASKVRLEMPEGEKLLSSDEVVLTVSRQVTSYAGIQMESDFQQEFDVEAVVKAIAADSLVNVAYNGTRTISVAVQPADASKGKKLQVRSLSTLIATVSDEELVLDENGQAEITITGELPGATVVNLSVEGTDIERLMTVNVKEAEKLVTIAPKASRVTGTEVYRGTMIQLSSETDNAVIRYTLDGSDPADAENDNVLTYNDDAPIVIADDNVTIKAVARGIDLESSEVVTFNYSLKQSNLGWQMPQGWTWISHNLENAIDVAEFQNNADRIVGQTTEAINDPAAGLIGNLHNLLPATAYKVKVSANTEKRLSGYLFNATTNTVSVEQGWNWIGYPLNQTMTIDEALAYFTPAEGDFIVGQDGYVEFADGEWQGTLEGMVPGKGYLYKANANAGITFNTAIVSNANARIGKRNVLLGSPWACNAYAWPNVMPLTAQLYVDGEKAGQQEWIIAAFADTECRGIGQWKNGRVMMNVYGEGNEEIRFVAYNQSDETFFDLNEHLVFNADNVGSWHAPFALTLGGETTGVDVLNSDLTVTPAVAYDHITVSAGGRNIEYIALTNMAGTQVVAAANVGPKAVVATGSLAAGVYILTVKADGKTYYKKMMKANK